MAAPTPEIELRLDFDDSNNLGQGWLWTEKMFASCVPDPYSVLMNIETLFEKIVAELGGYFSNIFGILRFPESAFILGKRDKNLSTSKSFIYAVISALIGSSFLKFLLSRNEEISVPIVLAPMVYWVIEGAFLYLVCKLLRGRGTFTRTVSGILQVDGAIYVLSAVAGLCTWAVLKTLFHFSPSIATNGFLSDVVNSPVLCFYFFDVILSIFYVPMMLSGIHNFGFGRKAILIAFALIGIGISYCIYVATGSLVIREANFP